MVGRQPLSQSEWRGRFRQKSQIRRLVRGPLGRSVRSGRAPDLVQHRRSGSERRGPLYCRRRLPEKMDCRSESASGRAPDLVQHRRSGSERRGPLYCRRRLPEKMDCRSESASGRAPDLVQHRRSGSERRGPLYCRRRLPEKMDCRSESASGRAPDLVQHRRRVGTPWTSLLPATMHGAGSRAKNGTARMKMDCRRKWTAGAKARAGRTRPW